MHFKLLLNTGQKLLPKLPTPVEARSVAKSAIIVDYRPLSVTE